VEPTEEVGAEPAAEEHGAGEDLTVRGDPAVHEDPAIEGRGSREDLAVRGDLTVREGRAVEDRDGREGLAGRGDPAVHEDPTIEGRGGREDLAVHEDQTGADLTVREGLPVRETDTGEGLVGSDVRAILGDGQGGRWTDHVIGFLETMGLQNSRAVTLEDLYDFLSEALRAAGTPEAMIYAMRRTGLFLVEGYEHLMTDAEIDAWYTAIEDYETEVN